MQILGISGSPRRGGNTEIIINEALNVATAEGADVALIRLSDYQLTPCTACGTCFDTKQCTIQDDAETLYQQILNADGVILGSPSYFQGITAQMKTFIDRIGYLHIARGRKDFEGKVGAAIAVARRSGLAATWSQMSMFLTASRMMICSGGRVFAVGRLKGEVTNDAEGVETARHLGRTMAKTISASKQL
jgi:multimeric flavodoxin WrbA